MLRADIDALPVHEAVDLPFRSFDDGVMHACGHDVHTAALLGAARVLAEHAGDLPGRYVLVFQPGEESLCGARTMVEGGLFDDLTVDGLVGFHVTSMAPPGLVGLRPGIAMSEAHSLTITLRGGGGHGAMPSDQGDVVRAVAVTVGELAGTVEGLRYEGTDCVCSAGMLAAGTAVNVVPELATLRGTLRTFTDDQREEALGRLRALCGRIGSDFGVAVELTLTERTPAVVNDPSVTARVEAAARALPDVHVVAMPPVAPSDDVSEFLNRVPGCYFFVGGALADGSSGVHHSPTFALDESSLRVGAAVLLESAVALAGG